MSASYERFRQQQTHEPDLAGKPRFHKPDRRLTSRGKIPSIAPGDSAYLRDRGDRDFGCKDLYVHVHSPNGVGFDELPTLIQEQSPEISPESFEVLAFRACDPVIDRDGYHGVMARIRRR